MAYRLIRPLRGTILTRLLHQERHHPKPINHNIIDKWTTTRSYISEMRKSAFEGNILRLLRYEIEYELERSPLPQPISEYNSFVIDERPGEQWIRLTRKFGENEELKLDVTMFDASFPVQKTGSVPTGDDVQLHISMIVDVSKGENNDVLEFVCSAWPDSIEICKVFTRGHDRIASNPYVGPEFKELDDDLQTSLYEFLEARGINDDLAVFLHQYMKTKDKAEFIRWMEKAKSFIGKK